MVGFRVNRELVVCRSAASLCLYSWERLCESNNRLNASVFDVGSFFFVLL